MYRKTKRNNQILLVLVVVLLLGVIVMAANVFSGSENEVITEIGKKGESDGGKKDQTSAGSNTYPKN